MKQIPKIEQIPKYGTNSKNGANSKIWSKLLEWSKLEKILWYFFDLKIDPKMDQHSTFKMDENWANWNKWKIFKSMKIGAKFQIMDQTCIQSPDVGNKIQVK